MSQEESVVAYSLPPFHRRVVANLMDFLIFALLFIALFIPTNAITKATPGYRHADKLVNTRRVDSGLYIYESSTKTYITYPTYYDNYATQASGYVRVSKCAEAIDNFINYIGNEIDETAKQKLQKDYDEYRLSLFYKGEPYFVKNNEGVVETNKNNEAHPERTCMATNEQYYKNVYHIYILQNCAGYMVANFPDYKNSLMLMSNLLFFEEIPIAFILSGTLTYFVPTLIFKRGRTTLGKLAFRIGLIDQNLFSPSFGRNLARFAIFFFGELVLSLFTFTIPIIVSFSMMSFSKRKQGFPDFMLGLLEVGTSDNNIYFNKYEAAVLHFEGYKKGISFHMKKQEY